MHSNSLDTGRYAQVICVIEGARITRMHCHQRGRLMRCSSVTEACCSDLGCLCQVLVIGKISSAIVLAGAAYQDEAKYARMTGVSPKNTRLVDDKGRTDTQVGGCHHLFCMISSW